MSTILIYLPELLEKYKCWISRYPQFAGECEVVAKWLSFFIAGKINNSHILTELVCCLTNLLVLLNDCIIKKSLHLEYASSYRLKLWLTVLEYCETMFELGALRAWGRRGKWVMVTLVQLMKCIMRLMLVYKHKECVVDSPPIPVLNRSKLKDEGSTGTAAPVISGTFRLPHSGRLVRTIDGSPSLEQRSWIPPVDELSQCQASAGGNMEADICPMPNLRHVTAETLFVMKPLLHLALLRIFGRRSFKPYLAALSSDFVSLYLHDFFNKTQFRRSLDEQNRVAVYRRAMNMTLYLLRSPLYEKGSRDVVMVLLYGTAHYVPLTHIICHPLAEYLPFWQSIYSHMWST